MKFLLIVDDQRVVRNGIADLINDALGKQVVCHAVRSSGLTKFMKENPLVDLVIYDPQIPKSKSVVANVEALKRLNKKTKILLYSSLKHTEFNLLECLSIGACGFLAKSARSSELLKAVISVLYGRPYLREEVRLELVRALRRKLDHKLFSAIRAGKQTVASSEFSDKLALSPSL